MLCFSGSEVAAKLLQSQLQHMNIPVLIKNERDAGRLSGFGSLDYAELYIPNDRYNEASHLINEFKHNNP